MLRGSLAPLSPVLAPLPWVPSQGGVLELLCLFQVCRHGQAVGAVSWEGLFEGDQERRRKRECEGAETQQVPWVTAASRMGLVDGKIGSSCATRGPWASRGCWDTAGVGQGAQLCGVRNSAFSSACRGCCW